MSQFKILAPCGMLGYGFPEESFRRGMELKPDAIVVDAGSTDAGPHKLGLGTAIVSKQACKKDLTYIIRAGAEAGIPVVIGSAGGSGGRVHVLWTKAIVDEILEQNYITGKKIAIIWADISKDIILGKLKSFEIEPLGLTVGELTEERVNATSAIVAQMGHEPIVKALEAGADIIICGRAYDPSPFAAVAIHKGYDEAYAYHAGKVLECAALCTDPGTTKDCVLGIIEDGGFVIESLNPRRKCTAVSIAAHTFYEKEHPSVLRGPGMVLNLDDCVFSELDDLRVRVSGSRLEKTDKYYIKLEGAMRVAFRTFVVAGIRDERLVSRINEIENAVTAQVREYYNELSDDDYTINYYNYGLNGVLGELEPNTDPGHELGVVFEVLARTQDMANMICSTLRSTFLHYGYEGRKSTAGNLAFPFAPSDIAFGPVFEFSVYHLMAVNDALEHFPIEYYDV